MKTAVSARNIAEISNDVTHFRCVSFDLRIDGPFLKITAQEDVKNMIKHIENNSFSLVSKLL